MTKTSDEKLYDKVFKISFNIALAIGVVCAIIALCSLQAEAAEKKTTLAVEQLDTDGDGIADVFDNGTEVYNPAQRDQDGDNAGTACDADLDNDGDTDGADFIIWRGGYLRYSDGMEFGDCARALDHDEDNTVGFFDFRMYRNLLHGKPPGPSALPYIVGLEKACRP